MPNNLVKSFAEKSGKSVEEVEKLWKKAEDITKEQGIPEDSDNFYKVLVGVLKKMLKFESATITTTSANVGDGQSGQYKKKIGDTKFRFKQMFTSKKCR